eukprot:751958-Hanusia_phi.AAC.2
MFLTLQHLTLIPVVPMRNLVVFDFDHTLIGVDSDEHVLGLSSDKDAAKKRLADAGAAKRWCEGFASELECLQREGVTMERIKEALMEIQVDQELRETIHRLGNLDGVELRILSDANNWFISTVLQSNGLDKYITKIVSNVAEVDGGFLRVKPYHTSPHPEGSTSPANLCKGRVMRSWLNEVRWDQVVYCGDGPGDFEGAVNVPLSGKILARKDWPLHRLLEKSKEVQMAQVQPWQDHKELARLLSKDVEMPVLAMQRKQWDLFGARTVRWEQGREAVRA